jgi:3-hydroxybutyryl-CoA dehydrogenase
LRDITTDALGRGMAAIEKSTEKFVSKGSMTSDERTAALERITTTTDLAAVSEVDVVVEAVFEDVDVKRELFGQLDRICKDSVVLATNTSAIPVTNIAAATGRPEAVVGTHFFSPVPMMGLCELVRGRLTSDETLATARRFAESVGKTCVVVNRDVAGFVTTRLITALVMEAIRLYESGVASAEDIDTACKLGFGHAMGPLATTDLTGLDILHHATKNIYDETADTKFFPPEILTRMVAAGELGRKAGRGFYTYE